MSRHWGQTLDNDRDSDHPKSSAHPPHRVSRHITHQDIWSERETLAVRSNASAVQSCIHGSASFTSNKRFAKTFRAYVSSKETTQHIAINAKVFARVMFHSLNYELGKSTRGHTYIFRRTEIWPRCCNWGRDQRSRPRCLSSGAWHLMVAWPVRHWQWVGTQVLWPPPTSWSSQLTNTR